jgi:hypothetical protein
MSAVVNRSPTQQTMILAVFLLCFFHVAISTLIDAQYAALLNFYDSVGKLMISIDSVSADEKRTTRLSNVHMPSTSWIDLYWCSLLCQ